MVATKKTEYLYQTPEDCFPEALLVQENAKSLVTVLRMLLPMGFKQNKPINYYALGEEMLYNDLMSKTPNSIKTTYVRAGQTNSENADLRPLLK